MGGPGIYIMIYQSVGLGGQLVFGLQAGLRQPCPRLPGDLDTGATSLGKLRDSKSHRYAPYALAKQKVALLEIPTQTLATLWSGNSLSGLHPTLGDRVTVVGGSLTVPHLPPTNWTW